MKPVIIGVAGGSGSGKTTVVEVIIDRLGRESVTRIQHDSYYFDRAEMPPAARESINYDHPDALDSALLARHLHALRGGKSIDVPVYDFTTHTRRRQTRTVKPKPAVILEGILALAEPAIRGLLDLRVFVDTDADLRILRRLQRDTIARHRSIESVIAQYLSTVRPMHLEFVEPSKRHAHVIIPEGGHNDVAVETLITKIRSLVDDN